MNNQTKTAVGNHFSLVASMKIKFVNHIPDTLHLRKNFILFQILRFLFTMF